MKNLFQFKTFGLLSVVGLAGFISCTKQTNNPAAPALTPVKLNFTNVYTKLGGASSTSSTMGRYDGSGKLSANLDTIRSDYFESQTGNNLNLDLATSLFSALTSGGEGDLMALELDVEPGATVTVSKEETPDSTMFAFAVGKKSTDKKQITDLPKNLVKDNVSVLSMLQGDLVLIQLNTTYTNLASKMATSGNKVVLTVTASKSGMASVTKTLTVKAASSGGTSS